MLLLQPRNLDSDGNSNLDNNYFLRTEENNGRKEFVLFDADGPGAVVRFWTTFNRYDREGVLRFYFDNETEPRIEKVIRCYSSAEDQYQCSNDGNQPGLCARDLML